MYIAWTCFRNESLPYENGDGPSKSVFKLMDLKRVAIVTVYSVLNGLRRAARVLTRRWNK